MKGLELRNITFDYQSDQPVLKGINAHFESGKMYALLGESGGGKTTLLSLIGGLDEPTKGVIYLDGKLLSKNDLLAYRRKEIAFVFQSYNLIDYLTPAENVSLATNESPFPILEKVGLTKDQATRSILKLSGGQQQRVAIARALASSANILLADEPTGNLDEETANGIIKLLKKSAHELNKLVIVVTHSQQLASHADVVFQLKSGLLQKIEL